MSGTFNKAHLIRQVDLFTLKLFMTVVEEGQVGRAAARENIAASAATKRIQDLEEIVGVQLFDRNPRGVVPSAAGLVLARHLAQVFGTFEDIRRDFSEFTEGVRGTIRVASTGGIIFQYLSRDVAEYARNFPLVDLDLREHANAEVLRAVIAGDVDVGVCVATPGLPETEVDTLDYRHDRLIAVVPVEHPLAERASVKVSDLFAHTYIAISPSTSLMAHVRQAAAEAGVEFKPKYTVNSVYAATGLVRVNQGVTVQPDHMLTADDLKAVRAVPLAEDWARRRLFIATPRGRGRSVAVRNFITQLTERPG